MASPKHLGNGWFGIAGMTPFTILLLGFAGYTWVQVIIMAFAHVTVQGGQFIWKSAGLDNFRAVAHDSIALTSIIVTVIFIVATVTLTVLFGLVLALLVQPSVLLKSLAQFLIVWPAIVAPVVVSLIWLLILSPNVGALNKVLDSLSLPTQSWLGVPLGAMSAIIIVDVWHWTPVAFLLLYSALCAIDEDMLEAARCDGAKEWQVAAFVQVPILLPAILTTAFIRAVMGVKAFDEMYLLTSGGPDGATTLVSLHIRDVFFDQLNMGYGAAFSIVVALLVALTIAAIAAARASVAHRRTRTRTVRAPAALLPSRESVL